MCSTTNTIQAWKSVLWKTCQLAAWESVSGQVGRGVVHAYAWFRRRWYLVLGALSAATHFCYLVGFRGGPNALSALCFLPETRAALDHGFGEATGFALVLTSRDVVVIYVKDACEVPPAF